MQIVSVDRLSSLSGIVSSELTGHELTYEEGAVTVVPWPVARAVAKSMAKRHPDRVLLQLKDEERDLRRLLARAQSRSEREADDWSLDVRLDDERGERQSRDLRREWVGGDVLKVHDELAVLRAENRRVTVAARAAVDTLERAGCRAEAQHLRQALDAGGEVAG